MRASLPLSLPLKVSGTAHCLQTSAQAQAQAAPLSGSSGIMLPGAVDVGPTFGDALLAGTRTVLASARHSTRSTHARTDHTCSGWDTAAARPRAFNSDAGDPNRMSMTEFPPSDRGASRSRSPERDVASQAPRSQAGQTRGMPRKAPSQLQPASSSPARDAASTMPKVLPVGWFSQPLSGGTDTSGEGRGSQRFASAADLEVRWSAPDKEVGGGWPALHAPSQDRTGWAPFECVCGRGFGNAQVSACAARTRGSS